MFDDAASRLVLQIDNVMLAKFYVSLFYSECFLKVWEKSRKPPVCVSVYGLIC
jgi:hypothetical protein